MKPRPCSACANKAPALDLTVVWLSGERRLDVCPECIRDAVAGMMADIDAENEMQGVTPDTCA